MKKNLYYTIEKEISDDGETLNGNKTITVYEIVNNEPNTLASINCSIEDNSWTEIQHYLEDNGYNKAEFEFILL